MTRDYDNELREGFRCILKFHIQGLTVTKLVWGSDKEKPWFTCQGFTSHIYPEDVLRCLDLVGIDPDRAHLAVDQVFKLHSFTPLYNILSHYPFLMPATLVGGRGRGEKGETKSPKKSSAVNVLKFILGALVVVGAAIAPRLLRSNWASTRPGPCFATSSMGPGCFSILKTRKQSAPGESSSSRSQQHPPEARASASQESSPFRTRPFKERLSFRGTGLFTGKLSLQRNRAFITQKRWEPWEELQRTQSLGSHQLVDQSSVGSNNEPAEQLQPLRTEASVVQRVWRTLSDKYNLVLRRNKEWVDNGKILTEESPEIKEWRDIILKADGEPLPKVTQVCVHLQKRKTMLGIPEITFTKQGTLTERWAVDRVTKLLEDHLVIDGVKVKAGAQHECDHVTLKNAGSMTDLRHEDTAQDRSPVVIMTKERHRTRTTYSQRNRFLFNIDNLTARMPDLFKQTRRADQDFWMSEENKEGLLDDSLRPAFVAKQYSLGQLCNQVRMESHLRERGFHPNQATAFLLNEKVIEINESATAKFVSSRISLPRLDAESEKVYSQLTEGDQEDVYRSYAQKIRSFNLSNFTISTAQCVKLAHTLELYSESLAGKADSCNAVQTAQHKETKTEIMKGFRKTLDKANIPQAEAKEAVNKLLTSANVKKNGTLRAGKLSRQLKQLGEGQVDEVREIMRERVCKIGFNLNANTLYAKGGTFKIKTPSDDILKRHFEQSMEEVRSKVSAPSRWTQDDASQWSDARSLQGSDAGSSDQGSL